MGTISKYETDFTDSGGFVLDTSGFRLVITKGYRRVAVDYVESANAPEYGPGPGDITDATDGYVWRRIAEAANSESVGDEYTITMTDGTEITGLLQPPVFASPIIQSIKGLKLADHSLRRQGNSHEHTVELHASSLLKPQELDIMAVIAIIPDEDYEGASGTNQFNNVDQFTKAWRDWNDAFMARTLDDNTVFMDSQSLVAYKVGGFISKIAFGQEVLRFEFDQGQFSNFEFQDLNSTTQDQNWGVSMKMSCLVTSVKTIPSTISLPA